MAETWSDSTDSQTIQCFYSTQQLELFAWCVRLSRLFVGFRTYLKSMHFYFTSFQTETRPRRDVGTVCTSPDRYIDHNPGTSYAKLNTIDDLRLLGCMTPAGRRNTTYLCATSFHRRYRENLLNRRPL